MPCFRLQYQESITRAIGQKSLYSTISLPGARDFALILGSNGEIIALLISGNSGEKPVFLEKAEKAGYSGGNSAKADYSGIDGN
jgi:hypothetical protein